MRLAVIAPPHHLKILEAIHQDYHLALAQHLMLKGEYFDWHKMRAAEGHHVIVDNGAAEGEMPDFDYVVGIANQTGATEIVLPDILRRGIGTIQLWWQTEPWMLVPPEKRLIVPQGNTWAEWCQCAITMHQTLRAEGGFKTWGIAKHLERLAGGRAWAIGWLMSQGWLEGQDVHLLGCWGNPVNEIYSALSIYSDVRGIDTGAPLAYAAEGLIITGPERASLDWEKVLSTEAQKAAIKNARVLKGVCNGAAA